MARLRVMIVSPQALFREALTHLLAGSPDFELAVTAASLAEAQSRAADVQPDVIVLGREDASQPFPLQLLALARLQVVAMTLDSKEVVVYSRRSLTLDTAQQLYQVLQSSQ